MLTQKQIKKFFPWTWEYITENLLPEDQLQGAEISLVHTNEIFVKHPDWDWYYGSNFGRCINAKDGHLELVGNETKKDPTKYVEYCFSQPGRDQKTVSAHRMVADIYLPNFWEGADRNKLQAHHINHIKSDNVWTNIMLVPTSLHYVLNRTKKTALFADGEFREINLYDIMAKTGLSLDEMILATKNKPEKSVGGKWSIFEIQGNYIGFQFLPNTPKKGRKKKQKAK